MITLQQINDVFTSTTSQSLQLHVIVNGVIATDKIVDPSQFVPVGEPSGSDYLQTLVDVESTLSGSSYVINNRGDTIGLSNDTDFNVRIGQWVSIN